MYLPAAKLMRPSVSADQKRFKWGYCDDDCVEPKFAAFVPVSMFGATFACGKLRSDPSVLQLLGGGNALSVQTGDF